MSGKRRKYTPEFREQAARLVIETGRPVAHVAAEIGIGEQVLGRWVRLAREAASAGVLLGCLMLMNAWSWSVCAVKMPNCVWTASF
jgi:transposase-like protein